MSRETIGVVGQYVSMVLLIVGIIIEVAVQAHIGFVFITSGGLVWGVATKIRGK